MSLQNEPLYLPYTRFHESVTEPREHPRELARYSDQQMAQIMTANCSGTRSRATAAQPILNSSFLSFGYGRIILLRAQDDQ
jgi:hypothetical protein